MARLLGAGGFSLAYLALQGRWGFQVCLKEFFPRGCTRAEDRSIRMGSHPSDGRLLEGQQAFRDEAACLARFNHPGIVRVLGSFEENGTSYLVQEMLDGMTLGDGLQMAGTMKEPTVLKVAQQVGQALLMVHAAGLVHSDLKPDNIFLTGEGRYVLLDFGLTRGFLSAHSARLGGRGLSSGYAPPEQYLEGKKLAPAADVYAFAATLYALLTGEVPTDALQRKKGQPLPALSSLNPSVTPRVEEAILEALTLDENRRTPGVREFLHKLGLDVTPKAVSYKPPPFKKLWVQKAHTTPIGAMCLCQQQGRLYTAAHDGELKVWRWPDLDLVGQVKVDDDPVCHLAVSPSGSFLVTAAESGMVKLWETTFTATPLLLSDHTGRPMAVAIQGDNVAIALAGGKCRLMLPTFLEPFDWVAHAGPCNSVDFHPEGKFLVTAGQDGAVRFWSLPDPQLLHELKGHSKGIHAARLSPNGQELASSSMDQSVILWDTLDFKRVREFQRHSAAVFDAQFTCHDNLAVSLCSDRHVRGLSLDSGQIAYALELSERTTGLNVDTSRPLFAVSQGDSVHVYEIPEHRGSSGVQPVTATLSPRVTEARDSHAGVDESYLLGKVIGGYKLVEHLGSGGMATVYKGLPLDERDGGTAVAVKILRPDQVSADYEQRFSREIQVCMKLHHPSVVTVLDWGSQDGLSYLVMEYVEGVPLRNLIPPGGMDFNKAKPIFDDIIEGLSYAHGRGIVHRDLKPENVMVGPTGRAKVMDFGLARDRHVQTVTKLGSAMGTAEYIAPEQLLRGPARSGLTEKSDQYALGILIFEALCGRRPFEWDDDPIRLVKILGMHMHDAPPSMVKYRSDVPPGVEAAVNRMLSKDPDERFPTVDDAGYALGQGFKGAG